MPIKVLKELPPLKTDLAEIEELEKLIKKAFMKELYGPLLIALSEPKSILNAKSDALREALKSGRIRYTGMGFYGKFSGELGKELRDLGAVYDKWMGAYLIARYKLPPYLQKAIDQSEIRFQKRVERVQAAISKIVPEKITEVIKSAGVFEKLLKKTDRDVERALKQITVTPKLSKDARDRIATEWQNNMDLYIKGFTKSEIARLRKAVMQSTLAGNRYETMVRSIQKRYGVSERKAHFWARQETNLLVTKMKEIRYEEAGVHWYRWRCVIGSPTHPVRPAHKALDGKLFRFDDPPITTEPGQPVRRNNPGCDWNCRCVAIPLLIIKKSIEERKGR